MEKVFETQEEMTGYITGKVKGGFIANVEGLPHYAFISNRCQAFKENRSFNEYPVKVIATRIDKNEMFAYQEAVLEKVKMPKLLKH